MHKGAQCVLRSLKPVPWNRGWKKPSFCLESSAAEQEKKECRWHLFCSPLWATASHHSLLPLRVQPAGHIMPLHVAQRRTEASTLPRKCTKINVPHSSNHETGQRKPEQFRMSHEAQTTIFCSCQWTSHPALSSLGRAQNAKASQPHWLHPSRLSLVKQSVPCTRAWKNTQIYTKKQQFQKSEFQAHCKEAFRDLAAEQVWFKVLWWKWNELTSHCCTCSSWADILFYMVRSLHPRWT